MLLPDYWLPRPASPAGNDAERAFDELLTGNLALDGCPSIEYNLPFPKWQFLCYVADHHDIALHGSGNPDIAIFEPRQSNDLSEFGNQRAVYAASDGIWSMFFAIADRERFKISVTNACIRVVDEKGESQGPYYVFSVSRPFLPLRPWRTGTVYLLPRTTLISQPPMPFGSSEVHIAQLASLSEVRPLAKLTVQPEDFPFLAQVRGQDDGRLQELATAIQTGAPWPEDK